jgi:N-acetylmuramoyl-L-alanine amidase
MSLPRVRLFLAAAAVLAAATGTGCARAPRVPPSTAPPPEAAARAVPAPLPRAGARAGYDGDSGYRADLDVTALAGRAVVLDPGHGGRWAGSLGGGGTRESDVNLRVALELAGMLRQAGARVRLTRDTDTSLVASPESTLAADLRLRGAFADSVGAEVFLSLHHNAEASGRRDVNETQTYYRNGDEGPSLDLAQAIHRHLVRGLAIGVDRLLPGNYAVLRSTQATSAVLGEPSHLTFAPAEARLADPRAIRLEAECYFMGLLDYFRAGVPAVTALAWESKWVGPDAYRPIVASVSQAPDGIFLWVDGAPVSASRVAREYSPGAAEWTLRYAPAAPWRDGGHVVRLQVRNPDGNHSRARADTLWIEVPPERLTLEAKPESLPAGLVGLTARALDAWGRTVAVPLTQAEMRWSVERLGDAGRAGPASSGEAGGSACLLPNQLEPTSGEAHAYLDAAGGRAPLRVRAEWRGLQATLELPVAQHPSAWATGFVTRTDNGRGVAGARVGELPPGASVATDPNGFYALWAPRVAAGTARLSAAAPGFFDPGLPPDSSLRLAPLAGGALFDRRIVLDPEGGGDDPAGEGPSGTRASLVNLAVARLAREYLERAGAQVLLTRESESSTPLLARVQASERFRGERLVRIGRRTGAPSAVGYFPGSVGGKGLAQRLHRRLWAAEEADTLRRVGDDTTADGPPGRPGPRRAPVLLEDANFVLQQTSCPSVSVRVGDLARAEDESRFLDAAWRHREAYLIYLALAEDLGAASDSLATVRIRLTASGVPRGGALLWLDGFALITDVRGEAAFFLVDRRVRHLLELAGDGAHAPAAAWIDPAQGTAWRWESGQPAPVRLGARP